MTQLLTPRARLTAPPCSASSAPRRRPDFRLGYILLLPLLLVAISSKSFLYDPPGFLDSHAYLGYFLHYTDHLPQFDSYYKISRLPWVLPGFAVYQLFGPTVAAWVLPLGTMIFTLASLYLTLRDALDARAALLTIALLGTCQAFIAPGGWNYHMTITLGYYLVTVLCLGRAIAGSRAWYVLAGASLALMVHTHLYMVAMIPGLFAHYVFGCRAEGRRLSLFDVLRVVGGSVAATVVLGGINVATGGKFLFFKPQIEYTLGLARNGNHWHHPGWTWIGQAAYLLLSVIALLSCPLTWYFQQWRLGPRGRSCALRVVGFQVQFLLAVLGIVYYQFVKQQNVLDTPYLAACLLAPASLAVGGFFYALPRVGLGGRVHLSFLIALLALGVPLALPHRWVRVPLSVPPLVLVSGLACAGLLCLVLARRRVVVFVAGLALLGVANTQIARSNPGTLCRDVFNFCLEADEFTSRLDLTLRDIKYWYDDAEITHLTKGNQETRRIFDDFVSTRGWLGNLLGGAPVPAIADLQPKHLEKSHRVAVLSNTDNREEYCRRIEARFAELRMPLRRQAQREFHHGELDLSMVVYEVEHAALAER